MSEVRREAIVELVDYVCDECGAGRMLPTGKSYPVYPMKHEHECEDCKVTRNFKVQYPLKVFTPVKQPA